MKQYAIITAIILVSLIFPATILAWQNTLEVNSEKAVAIAIDFLKNSPTFHFDGVIESIKVQKVSELEKYPVLYVIEIDFSCKHGGYGDRSGEYLIQVVSPHSIIIYIENNHVIKAVIDSVWDELNQKYIKDTDAPKNDPITSETVINIAVKYFINKYQLNAKIPDEWETKNLTPDKLLGYQTLQYTSGIWKITIKNPVIQYPIYDLTIEYFDVKEIKLSLTIDQQANIVEK